MVLLRCSSQDFTSDGKKFTVYIHKHTFRVVVLAKNDWTHWLSHTQNNVQM